LKPDFIIQVKLWPIVKKFRVGYAKFSDSLQIYLLHRVSEKKTSKIIFDITTWYVKLPPNLIIFGKRMANSL